MQEQVLEAMRKAGKPQRPGDVAKALGADPKDVSKAIQVLKESGKVTSPKRCFYQSA
ncbi:MAG: transcriptional regulator [Desulfovibrionaceae bacterium]